MFIPNATFRNPEYIRVHLPDTESVRRLLYQIEKILILQGGSSRDLVRNDQYIGVALAVVYSTMFDSSKSHLLATEVRIDHRIVEFRGRALAMFVRLDIKLQIFRRPEILQEMLNIYLEKLREN